MGTPQEPLHGGLEQVAPARGGKAISGTRTCAQQGPAGDGKQPPLVPRSGSFPRLRPGVCYDFQCQELSADFLRVHAVFFPFVHGKRRSQ
jgi:hypothetical protein